VHYSVGFDCDERARAAIHRVPESAWEAVSDTEGNLRDLDDAGVVELTGLLREHPHGDQLANWPADMRVICRRERPSAGAQLSLFEAADGWRYQLIATNTPTGQPTFLEARHRPKPGSRTTFATPKPPASNICPRNHMRSTRPGAPRP
jgi:hypothetical protein